MDVPDSDIPSVQDEERTSKKRVSGDMEGKRGTRCFAFLLAVTY